MIMRDTIFCAVGPDADRDAITAVGARHGQGGPGLRARLPAAAGAAVRRPVRRHPRHDQGQHLHRGRGRRRLPAAVLRQPRHHDRRGHARRRRHGTRTIVDDAVEPDDGASTHAAEINTLARTWRDTDPTSRPRHPADRHLPARRLAPQAAPVHAPRRCAPSSAPSTRPACRSSRSPTATAWADRRFNYGFSSTPEQELIKIAAETAKHAKIAFLMLPGVGTKDDIRAAQDNGGSICRIATHCTEADSLEQHFGLARELGLETVGFLMMSHTQPPEVARQAGADHGRCRLPVRLRRRLRRRADHGRRLGPRGRARRRDRRRGHSRLPRPREPRPRRRATR